MESSLTDQTYGRQIETAGASPRVSVIIPTKNRTVDLALTVETLFRQSVFPAELIIVDQSESDDSPVKVKLLHSLLPDQQRLGLRLRYIHDPHIHGSAGARNV